MMKRGNGISSLFIIHNIERDILIYPHHLYGVGVDKAHDTKWQEKGYCLKLGKFNKALMISGSCVKACFNSTQTFYLKATFQIQQVNSTLSVQNLQLPKYRPDPGNWKLNFLPSVR
eukprot:scaffold1406_cov182-Ochromonas_danica.AAC.4